MEPITAGIMAGGSLLSGGLQAYFSWLGMEKQAEENKRARQYNRQLFDIGLGFEERKFEEGMDQRKKEAQQSFGLGKKRLQLSKEQFKEGTRQWNQSREDMLFNRRMNMMGGLMQMLNSAPRRRMENVNLWRSA